MARGRKSRSGGVVVTLVIVGLTLLAAIPNEVLIGFAFPAATATVICFYFYSQYKKAKSAVNKPESPRQTPRRAVRVSRKPAKSLTRTSRRTIAEDTLVSAGAALTPSYSEFKLPNAPRGLGAASWVPHGQSISVSGLTIPGGMLYVGTSLPTPLGDNDPCLIDPSKPVALDGDYTKLQISYRPSYSELPSEARRAYLNWLADGRKGPEVDIGYVFLFFYGLERRAVIDGAKDEAAQADWPIIADELRRLISIYGESSNSFRRYACELLDWVSLASYPSKLYDRPLPPIPKTLELPLYIRLALGQAAVDGAPVPVHLALAWAKLDPKIYLRTPAERCSEQFEQLFIKTYAELCGSGLVLPRNRTKLKMVYRPASSGFRGHQEFKLTFNDTPDVTALTAATQKLQEVVEAASKPLEAFSRALGKNPSARDSLELLLQLPFSLWPQAGQKSLQALKVRIGEGMVAIPFQDLLDALGAKTSLTKEKTLSLARTLESANVGFEPDVLSGARPPKPEDHVVLFALPPTEQLSRANGPYLAAALTLDLASAVATSDGEFGIKEVGFLQETVLSWKHLTPSHTRRLLAHLRLLMQMPASLTELKKKVEPLDTSVKETIAAFMATVAQSDGEVSPAEIKMLEQVYKALGIDSKKVFSDLHAIAAGTKPTVAAVAKLEESGFKLDPARIAALQKDTEQVSALLAEIFTDTEVPTAVGAKRPDADSNADVEAVQANESFMGLDDAHTALARMVLSRPEWTREELLDLAADLDLMLDGALERINEAAFDTHDMALFEGDDPITVNVEILENVQT